MSKREQRWASGIPRGVISRLPLYYRYLLDLDQKEVQRVSSQQLGRALSLTAAQIRSDLSFFGSFGRQGYGYTVQELLAAVSSILGLKRPYRMILIGAGNLGRAIANYPNFRKRGFHISAIFDSDWDLVGTQLANCSIQHASKLQEYLSEEAVDIGIIATPPEAAVESCAKLVQASVKGIWNFAPVHLETPDTVPVEHMHVTDSLLRLSLRITDIQEKQKMTGKDR